MNRGADDVDHPDQQLSLAGMLPEVGERYQHQRSGYIGVVLQVEQARHVWVHLRYDDKERRLSLGALRDDWHPYVPGQGL